MGINLNYKTSYKVLHKAKISINAKMHNIKLITFYGISGYHFGKLKAHTTVRKMPHDVDKSYRGSFSFQ